MSRCCAKCVPTAGVLAAAVTAALLAGAQLASGQAAQAAEDCLSAPDHAPAAGGHWYYHLDRARDRKCWYLVEPEARAPIADPPQPQPVMAPPTQPAPPPSPFENFFSNLSNGFTGQQSSPPSSQLPPPGTYTTQSVQPVDSGTSAPRPVHTARRTEDAQQIVKPHRPAHPEPVQVADHPAAPSDQTERDALFQQFLRWRGRQ